MFACPCWWHTAGKGKVMQISDLITSTPLLNPGASSVSLAEVCALFLWLGYHLSPLSLEMSPLSCPRVPCFALWKVEHCALSPSLQTWATPLHGNSSVTKTVDGLHKKMTFFCRKIVQRRVRGALSFPPTATAQYHLNNFKAFKTSSFIHYSDMDPCLSGLKPQLFWGTTAEKL